MEWLIDLLGWIGSLAVVAAYALNMYKKIKSDSGVFYLLNVSGGLLLVVYTIYKEAYANTFINIVWIVVAVPAIVKLIRNKNK